MLSLLVLVVFVAITSAVEFGSVIGLSAADKQDIVDRHNYLRTQRCVANLAWSDDIAQIADWWASQCMFVHSNATERKVRYIQILNNAGTSLPNDTSSMRRWIFVVSHFRMDAIVVTSLTCSW